MLHHMIIFYGQPPPSSTQEYLRSNMRSNCYIKGGQIGSGSQYSKRW